MASSCGNRYAETFPDMVAVSTPSARGATASRRSVGKGRWGKLGEEWGAGPLIERDQVLEERNGGGLLLRRATSL